MTSRGSKTEPSGFSFKKIIVAVDGSPNSERASNVAIGLARNFHTELTLLHVIKAPTYYLRAPRAYGTPPVKEYLEQEEREVRRWAEPLLDRAKAERIPACLEIVKEKSSIAFRIIQEATREKADLIVTGTRGRGGFAKLLLGSVSSGLVTNATCPVLVVR